MIIKAAFIAVVLSLATLSAQSSDEARRQDRDANQRFYGTACGTGQIVFEGRAGAPKSAAAWKETLAKFVK